MKSNKQKLDELAKKCRIYGWPFEQLYFGPIPETGFVQYSSPVLRLGLGGDFYLRFNKQAWLKCDCIFIPAGVTHEVLSTTGVIAKYWVEKESTHYPFFHNQLLIQSEGFGKRSNYLLSVFQGIYENKLSLNEARVALNNFFNLQSNVKLLNDRRILKLSEIIRNEPDYNFNIEHLALEVDLSQSRLLHLFKEETGTSYRKFRMWQRLRYAISIAGFSHSLTYAAVEAGFNDASHFTRCFKTRYGVAPSLVFKTLEMYEIEKESSG